MRRPSWWQLLAIAASALFLIIGLLAIIEPPFPGRWCEDKAVWRVCYREWLASLAGWAAIIAAGLALAATRQQIQQNRSIADREHRQAMRASYGMLMDKVDLLIIRLRRMIENVHAGRQMLATTVKVHDELLMEDVELNRLEAIRRFRELRTRVAFETQPWQRAKQHTQATDLQDELVALLTEIYRRLDQGQEIAEIARDLDG